MTFSVAGSSRTRYPTSTGSTGSTRPVVSQSSITTTSSLMSVGLLDRLGRLEAGLDCHPGRREGALGHAVRVSARPAAADAELIMALAGENRHFRRVVERRAEVSAAASGAEEASMGATAS